MSKTTTKIRTSLTIFYSGPICVKLRQVSEDAVPLHHLRGLCGACVACFHNAGHPHKMEELRFNVDGGGGEEVQPPGDKDGEPGPCLPVPECQRK